MACKACCKLHLRYICPADISKSHRDCVKYDLHTLMKSGRLIKLSYRGLVSLANIFLQSNNTFSQISWDPGYSRRMFIAPCASSATITNTTRYQNAI